MMFGEGGFLLDYAAGKCYNCGDMRGISVILIFSVGFALAHDAVCHEGGGKTSVKYLSDHEHEHGHVAHRATGHVEHSEETGEDRDHQGDMHDHQLKPLLAKREVSGQQRVDCIQIALAAFMTPDSVNAAAGGTNIHPVIYGSESSLPVYVRAQILLL